MTDQANNLPEELAAHRQAVYHYVLGMVRDPHQAEDLTQEALLRALAVCVVSLAGSL